MSLLTATACKEVNLPPPPKKMWDTCSKHRTFKVAINSQEKNKKNGEDKNGLKIKRGR